MIADQEDFHKKLQVVAKRRHGKEVGEEECQGASGQVSVLL